MPVISINSEAEYNNLKSSSPLLIIDFYATWCGPCKAISPIFDKLSNDAANSAASFARVDVDKLKSVAQASNITAMPTFIFLANGTKIDEVKGSDRHALESKVKKHVSAMVNSDTSASLVKGMISLRSKLDIKQLELLNAANTSSVRDLFDSASTSKTIESDCDEQLMIYIPFQESVKTHSLVIRVNPEETNHAPSHLRVFLNRPNCLSFDDVDRIPATQIINDVSYDDKGVAVVGLRFVKFQKVNSLVIFIEKNAGSEDVTKLQNIEVLGDVSANNSSGVVQKIDHDHD